MRYAARLVALLVLVGGIFALRAATLSTHQLMPADSELVVTLRGTIHGGEHTQTLEERVTAVVLGCRLEVNADPAGPIEVLDDDEFRVVLRPSLDRTDRRQLRGCMEDWRIDHVQVDVTSMVDRPR